MATTNPFSSLFGKSPFKPLQEHMRTVAKCAAIIPDLLLAVQQGDRTQTAALGAQINLLEHQADNISNEIHSHLPKSLFMPVDRRDILEIIEFQDDIADKAQDIADFFHLREMPLPIILADPVIALARRCVDACELAAKIQEELDELMDLGFAGKGTLPTLNMVNELNDIESDTDRMGEQALLLLFQIEDTMKPVTVIFWHQLIGWIGDMADSAEKVGDRLRLLLAR